MNEKDFVALSKKAIVEFYNSLAGVTDKKITENEVHTVWQCKALQNYKATFAIVEPDGRVTDRRYYEATYNGNKQEIYLDVYKKQKNIVVKVETGKTEVK